MPKLSRIILTSPGHDCLYAPCQHTPKGDHGIDGGKLMFALTDFKHAVTLELIGTDYPPTVTLELLPAHRREVLPANLSFHYAVKQGRLQARSKGCILIPGPGCYSTGGSGLEADRFWRSYAAPGLGINQPPSFWSALEALWHAEFEAPVAPVSPKTPAQKAAEVKAKVAAIKASRKRCR